MQDQRSSILWALQTQCDKMQDQRSMHSLIKTLSWLMNTSVTWPITQRKDPCGCNQQTCGHQTRHGPKLTKTFHADSYVGHDTPSQYKRGMFQGLHKTRQGMAQTTLRQIHMLAMICQVDAKSTILRQSATKQGKAWQTQMLHQQSDNQKMANNMATPKMAHV